MDVTVVKSFHSYTELLISFGFKLPIHDIYEKDMEAKSLNLWEKVIVQHFTKSASQHAQI